MRTLNLKMTACAFAAAALLTACGGGGTTPGANEEENNNSSAQSGDTSTCTAAPCINFSETTLGMVDFGGLGIGVVNDPVSSANKVAKLTKEPADETWAGVTVHLGGANNSVTRIDTSKPLTLRVYSPAVGDTIMVKIENSSDGGINAEASATSTKAGEWETLTFNYPNASSSATYNKVSVFPAFNIKPSANKDFYIDELKYTAVADSSSSSGSGSGSNTVLASFDGATLPTVEVFGGAAGTIEAGPTGSTGNALKVTRSGGEVWAGAWIPIPAIPSNAGTQVVSAKVYSPVAGARMVAKAEYGDNTGTGDVNANETVVVGWQTLTWTLSNLDASKTYNRFVVLPQLGTVGSGQSFYFDDVTVAASSSGSNPSSNSSGALSFSTGFSSSVLTASSGAIASSGGSNFDDWNCTGGDAICGGGAGGTDADSFAYFYYQTTSPATGLYSQIEVFGPNVTGLSTTGDTGGVTIGSQTKVNFNFNPNPEWFNSGDPKMGIVLTLGKRYSIDGGCHIQLHGVKPITSDGSTAYSMNLRNDFRVAANCGTDIAPDNVNAALAASPVISSFKVLGAGGLAAIEGRGGVKSTANLSVKTGDVYPTTVALKGAITFD